MLNIDLKARLKNKTFWISIIGTIVLLAQQCGLDISKFIPSNYAEIINSVFVILAMLGIVVDTSTPGVNDQLVNSTYTDNLDSYASSSTKSNTNETTGNTIF